MGIALLPDFIVEDALSAGRLVPKIGANAGELTQTYANKVIRKQMKQMRDANGMPLDLKFEEIKQDDGSVRLVGRKGRRS